jgi:hypothetical protein
MAEDAMSGFLIPLLLLKLFVPNARAQPTPYLAQTIDLSGPRVGATLLSSNVRELAREMSGKDIGPVISQFGWQIERRFFSSPGGGTAVTEFVGLLGGADQGALLPSLSWVVGYRTAEGVEFAAGPNLSVTGTALALAAGVTFSAGRVNFPVNLAVVPSRSGVRVSVLGGFNTRRP